MSSCMLIANVDHNNIIQVYSVNAMTRVVALEVGQSSQGTFEHISPDCPSMVIINFVLVI